MNLTGWTIDILDVECYYCLGDGLLVVVIDLEYDNTSAKQ